MDDVIVDNIRIKPNGSIGHNDTKQALASENEECVQTEKVVQRKKFV